MSPSGSTSRPAPPVTVLCGFLGAGKTTLLRHLLAQAGTAGAGAHPGRRWAAVVNDVAAVNIDAQLVDAPPAGKLVSIGNGCVCCTVRDSLAETLAELCATGTYDHVLVETTGVADPRAIAGLFTRRNAFGRSLGDFARLSSLVTVIDSRHFLDEWQRGRERPPPEPGMPKPVFELMVDQAECADVLLLNKCDLVAADELDLVERVLRTLNPRAELIRTERGQVACELLLDRARFDPVATPGAAKWIRVLQQPGAPGGVGPGTGVRPAGAAVPHEEEYGITSFVYAERRAFDRERFLQLVRRGLPAGLLRAKGFYWLAQQPADIGFLSVAGGVARTEAVGTWVAELRERGVITDAEIPASARAHWVEPAGDRRQELVFIGTGIDESAWRAALDACLT
ncbi:MAG: GTP-binding protein [Verrucomicrobia bacterium]|nr:GTP-binding protein [Verrucomicrobiota bacterium]